MNTMGEDSMGFKLGLLQRGNTYSLKLYKHKELRKICELKWRKHWFVGGNCLKKGPIFPRQYRHCNQTKGHEMGGTCGRHGREEK